MFPWLRSGINPSQDSFFGWRASWPFHAAFLSLSANVRACKAASVVKAGRGVYWQLDELFLSLPMCSHMQTGSGITALHARWWAEILLFFFLFFRVIFLQVSMNEGLTYITSSVHITTTECVSAELRHVEMFQQHVHVYIFLWCAAFLDQIPPQTLFLFFLSYFVGFSSEEALSSVFLSSECIFDPSTVCFIVVWRHHCANINAGLVPAVGSSADVVVLASLLHRGKFPSYASIVPFLTFKRNNFYWKTIESSSKVLTCFYPFGLQFPWCD